MNLYKILQGRNAVQGRNSTLATVWEPPESENALVNYGSASGVAMYMFFLYTRPLYAGCFFDRQIHGAT